MVFGLDLGLEVPGLGCDLGLEATSLGLALTPVFFEIIGLLVYICIH